MLKVFLIINFQNLKLYYRFSSWYCFRYPKIAMEIIDELETTKRKVYAGGIGYFSANGDFDTCIALRTAVTKNKNLCNQELGL